jgi:hypothetical protein
MLEEIADATLNKVKHFTIGFGRAGEEPAAKGTGVLVKHRELIGMTCAHVDKQGDDVGKGRADIRGLARCRRSLR